MKKIILVLALIFAGLSVSADIIAPSPHIVPVRYLMDYPEYKNITPDNIDSMSVVRYTEAGISERKVEDKNEVIMFYNFLKQIRLLNETKWSCTDNTTMYKFVLKDGKKAVIEIECDWVVLGGKHYNFDFPSKNNKHKKI